MLSRCGLRPNLIFLADHGFGANWDPNIWGEPSTNSSKISFLKTEAFRNRFIMVDKKTTDPWTEYKLDPNFQHERWSLYKRNEVNQVRADKTSSGNENPANTDASPKPVKKPSHPGKNPNPGFNPAPKSSLLFFNQGNKE